MCSAKVSGLGGPSASIATVTELLEGNVKDIAGKRRIQRRTKEHEKQPLVEKRAFTTGGTTGF
jgi:hypothetical protein